MAKCDVHNELTHLLQTDDAVVVSVDGTKGAVGSEGAGPRTQILKASLQLFFGQLPVSVLVLFLENPGKLFFTQRTVLVSHAHEQEERRRRSSAFVLGFLSF
ncbi:unnamed protein product [Citrullus colocynthis]|uniref:Uncharacterized protein n=1 Tax=Citrullus colocynthis TaxID=252529 RepID=A0ABP0Y0U3_9ROSI